MTGPWIIADIHKTPVQIKKILKRKGESQNHMSEKVWKILTRYFTPHNERFFKLINKRFGWTMDYTKQGWKLVALITSQ